MPEPPENPITEEKRVLGKSLFWEEQLSSDNTVACGACHRHETGSADSRAGVHPGMDRIFDTDDCIFVSPGVQRRNAPGEPILDEIFGYDVQVTESSRLALVK